MLDNSFMSLLTTELFTEKKRYYCIKVRVTCMFILKFEYKFTYKDIVVGIQCEAQIKRLVLEMPVPSQTVSSAIHGADDRNKGQPVLPVFCLSADYSCSKQGIS
jgi:hypothetical protein